MRAGRRGATVIKKEDMSMPATMATADLEAPPPIRTPDQRVRVFVSSTMNELAAERRAVRDAVTRLRLVPVMFELGARSHSPREVYRAYLAQSQIFVGVYWQSYGQIAPGQEVSGLEDEYLLSAGMPRLIYVKSPAGGRDPRLAQLLSRIRDGGVSYQHFTDATDLQRLVENDLAVLLSERFEMTRPDAGPVLAGTLLAGALPAPTTPLVDREDETAAVRDLVAGQGARLATLTGPGGVGKSRLAAEAARGLGSRFADGVRFVDLGPVQSADLVPAAIAAGLGLSTSGGRLLTDVVSYLSGKQLLLILDNFEQVTGAAPLVAELLAAAPGLVVLVTSRAILRISGEHEFPVPPLRVPPAGAEWDATRLLEFSSVRLFVDRARAAAPGFALTSQNAPAVAEICRRLDGLPLAIELAAARIRLLPPRALLAHLDEGMSVLTGGPRDLPERQRTLKNTLDWSFGLLSADEQKLFARLGVFAGSFGLPAAEFVGADALTADDAHADSATALMNTLDSLVDSSLVRPEPTTDEPRFRLLETIRGYALGRLRASGEWAQVHDRHAAYFLAMAEPGDTELRGAGQLAWLGRLEAGHDNLAAALSWLVDAGQIESALRLVWGTWRFWWLHGHADELTRYMEKILVHSGALPPRQRALALSGTAFQRMTGGDQAGARPLFEQSLPLYRQAGDTLGEALAAAALGHVLAAQHEFARASDVLEQTLGQLHRPEHDRLHGPERLWHALAFNMVQNNLGQIRLAQGDHARAGRLFAEALTAARAGSDRVTVLTSLYDLALSSQARGDLAGAAGLLTEGMSLAAETGDRPSAAYYLEALAAVADRQGEPERAVCLLSAADALLQANGSGWLHAYVPRARHGDDVLAGLRRRVGDAAFEQARGRGRSRDGNQVLRQAIERSQPAAVPA
jgi:predicted ATPase